MLEFKNITIKEAKSFKDRLIGLMFKKNINYALLFDRCNSIHTFFMKENIDVIMCDKDNNILYFYKDLKKNKIILTNITKNKKLVPHLLCKRELLLAFLKVNS